MRLLACLFSLVATFATAADLTLTAIDGTTQTLPASADGKPTLLFFVSPFCSTTKSFAKEIQQITVDHAAKVRVLIIECDPEVTRDIAIEHATVSEFTAPVLVDAGQALTKLVKATITPEAVLLDAKGAVYYQGRINDLYLGPPNASEPPPRVICVTPSKRSSPPSPRHSLKPRRRAAKSA